jgi:hypothetical protein
MLTTFEPFSMESMLFRLHGEEGIYGAVLWDLVNLKHRYELYKVARSAGYPTMPVVSGIRTSRGVDFKTLLETPIARWGRIIGAMPTLSSAERGHLYDCTVYSRVVKFDNVE